MVSMKSVAWKASAVATLAAAIVGLSAGPASAGRTTVFHGTKYTGTSHSEVNAKAKRDIISLERTCYGFLGRPVDSSIVGGHNGKVYNAQARVKCYFA